MKLLSTLHRKEKKTIILVTHDIDLVHYAFRVVHIKDGLVNKEYRYKKKKEVRS